ncbi:hypothetical protein L596_002090 [Steinernema carpocapsae]|uniref:Uncharacterized protein n=1 Tax=Steinernema carpocapsae TaxID=34508 RepID=A0A4U8UNG0_STECR|nr:hypothetical protein L596_002090 [Steinernema carpocapsae]
MYFYTTKTHRKRVSESGSRLYFGASHHRDTVTLVKRAWVFSAAEFKYIRALFLLILAPPSSKLLHGFEMEIFDRLCTSTGMTVLKRLSDFAHTMTLTVCIVG